MRDILIYNHAIINIYSCTVITAVIKSLVPMLNQCTCILIDRVIWTSISFALWQISWKEYIDVPIETKIPVVAFDSTAENLDIMKILFFGNLSFALNWFQGYNYHWQSHRKNYKAGQILYKSSRLWCNGSSGIVNCLSFFIYPCVVMCVCMW